jgi:hypothetical protein
MTLDERERATEDRLRRALSAHAAAVPDPADRWADIETAARYARRSKRTRRGIGAGLSLAAAITITVASVTVLQGTPTRRVLTTPATGPGATTLPRPIPTSSVPPVSSSVRPNPTSTTPAPTSAGPALAAGLQPVWPFLSPAEVRAWQAGYRAGGQQPWHLDPGQTALSFTDAYLGFTDINLIVNQSIAGRDAHVAVGFATSPGHTGIAAVIHLVRYGTSADSPWEVVGTDDTGGLTLTSPAYGSAVISPVVVGGTITGVDENIRVLARQLSTGTVVGQVCCHPAGGTNTPWSETLSYQGVTDPVLTIVATTGGHLLPIERFAITSVRV